MFRSIFFSFKLKNVFHQSEQKVWKKQQAIIKKEIRQKVLLKICSEMFNLEARKED